MYQVEEIFLRQKAVVHLLQRQKISHYVNKLVYLISSTLHGEIQKYCQKPASIFKAAYLNRNYTTILSKDCRLLWHNNHRHGSRMQKTVRHIFGPSISELYVLYAWKNNWLQDLCTFSMLSVDVNPQGYYI